MEIDQLSTQRILRLTVRTIWFIWMAAILSAGTRTERPAQAAGAFQLYLPVTTRNFPLITPFGVQATAINASAGLDQIQDAQITWVRRNGVRWADIEPNPGDRNWTANAALEAELKNAFNRGIKVILVVNRTPDWAQKFAGVSCGPIATENLQAFGDFMYDLVSRYKKPPYNIKYWEIWNEPDVDYQEAPDPNGNFGCWGDGAAPYFGGGYYADMLEIVYPRMKSADPEAQVLVGGLLLDCNPDPGAGNCSPNGAKAAKFLQGILDHNGAGDGAAYFDGVSFHAFDFYNATTGQYSNNNWNATSGKTGPVLAAKARYIRSVLSDFGVTEKFLMNTESALLCDNSCDTVFENVKAAYLVQNFAMALSEGLVANIWFGIFDWRNSGLLNPDLTPRPAYDSLQVARQRLANASYIGPITASDISPLTDLIGYKFIRAGSEVWVVWSAGGVLRTVNFASVPDAIYDYLGGPVPTGPSVPLDQFPKYIEWD